MTSKPPIKYTDMAIYIDEHIYEPGCDDNKIFLYIYHLAIMLAHKSRLFSRQEYYEGFALFFAERIFNRLKSPKQYILTETGEYEQKRVKSVLNYMKASLYGGKVDFEQRTYSQGHSIKPQVTNDCNNSEYRVVNQIRYYTNEFAAVETELCLQNIHRVIKACIAETPYAGNPQEYHNIYLSCLLTLLNSLILSKTDRLKIKEIEEHPRHTESYKAHNINTIYQNNARVILFHLDESMKDYIWILYRKVLKQLNDFLQIDTFAFDEKNLLTATIEELEGKNTNLTIYD